MNFIPDSCWTILFVAIAGLVLLLGIKIFKSKRVDVDVHVGSADVHINTGQEPEQTIKVMTSGTGDGNVNVKITEENKTC